MGPPWLRACDLRFDISSVGGAILGRCSGLLTKRRHPPVIGRVNSSATLWRPAAASGVCNDRLKTRIFRAVCSPII